MNYNKINDSDSVIKFSSKMDKNNSPMDKINYDFIAINENYPNTINIQNVKIKDSIMKSAQKNNSINKSDNKNKNFMPNLTRYSGWKTAGNEGKIISI